MGNLCGSIKKPKGIDLNSFISSELNNYDILKEIGHGAYGTIYVVNNMKSNKIFVMKKLNKKRVIINEINYFNLKSKHSNLIKYNDLILKDNSFYIIMGKYDTDLLDYLVNKGKLSEKKTKNYVAQILSGMKALEFYNYYHLDIKLENILLNTKTNNIVLTDFGCLTKIDKLYKNIKYPVGTKIYASPETLNLKIITRKSDIWSLGIITFMMLKNEKIKNDCKQNSILLDCNELSSQCIDFLVKTLEFNFYKRLSIRQCLAHKWLKS
jgi:serine/threonine protein kinase